MNLLKEIFKGLFKEELAENQSLKDSLFEERMISKDKDSRINQLETDIKSTKKDLSNLEKRKNYFEKEISILKKELEHIRKYSQEAYSRVTNLNYQIEVWKLKAAKEKEIARGLKDEIHKSHKEKDAIKRELDSLQTKYYSIKAEYDNSCQNTATAIETFKSENKALSDKLTIINYERDRLSEQVQILNENYTKKKEELVLAHAQEIQRKEDAVVAFRSQLESKDQELNAKQSEIDGLKSEIAIRSEKEQEVSERYKSLLDSRNSLQLKISECEALKKQLSEVRQSATDVELLNALRHDVSSKQEEITHLELSIQKLHEKISDLELSKNSLEIKVQDKEKECDNLRSSLKNLIESNSRALETERLLKNAQDKIEELKRQIRSLPSEKDLIDQDKEIARLKRENLQLQSRINTENLTKTGNKVVSISEGKTGITTKSEESKAPSKQKTVYRNPRFPYLTKPVALTDYILKKKDFPKIENDNIYAVSRRTIDEVYDCRTDKLVSAESIFLKWTAEEISRLRSELEEAIRCGKPYLICPCCRQMVNISSRRVGFGDNSKEIQYFTHAVRNIPCDFKRDYTDNVYFDGIEVEEKDRPDYINELRNKIKKALESEISSAKGIIDVKVSNWVFSEELPMMKRRLADVTAQYKDKKIAFELVIPSTNSAKLYDRDIFYLINHYQVFWILELNSKLDYSELSRSVAKDIMFTNKRNVFVFDVEAQEETLKRGELMLKCNWLDEDGEWYYQIDKNGKNGMLVSLDQITFDDDSCRPYYYDADDGYFLKHPSAEQPTKQSREELKKKLIESFEYRKLRDEALNEMTSQGDSVEVFFDGKKWGFKYGSLVFIDPTFVEEPEIIGSYAKVCEKGKFGIVNRFGEVQLKTIYHRIEILPNDSILYSNGKEWHILGIIDSVAPYSDSDKVKVDIVSKEQGIYHLVIEKNLFAGQLPEEVYFFGGQIFKRIKSLAKWILWYSVGERMYSAQWDNVEVTSDNKLKLIREDGVTCLTLDGTLSVEPVTDEPDYIVRYSLSNGFSIVEKDDRYWGIVDNENNYIVLPEYDMIEPVNERFLRFQVEGKWGVMSIKGDVIIDAEYNTIDSFTGDGFYVTKPDPEKPWESLSGKIDMYGNALSETVREMENGLRITKLFERFGLEFYDRIVLKHIYNSLFHWTGDKYCAKKGDYFGIIDIKGNVILKFECSNISSLKNNQSTVKIGARELQINSRGEIIEDEVIALNDGYKKIKKEGKWGITAPDGSELVSPKYDEITTFRGRLIGIINGSLVKLSAYYPYKLQMTGINRRINGRDMVQVSTLLFYIYPKRVSEIPGASASIVLINWAYNMKYATAMVATKKNTAKKVKCVDHPEDFSIGETINGKVVKIVKKNIRFKLLYILTPNEKKLQVYLSDLKKSGLYPGKISIGTVLQLTKMGFNEELDRTEWNVKIISKIK